MKKKAHPLLMTGFIGTLVFGLQFGVDYGRATWGNRDIWWTPKTMALPLSDTSTHFEMYLDGKPLQDHLLKKSLTILDAVGNSHQVAQEDISVRFNNWQGIRASYLHKAIFSALFLGTSLTCLLFGIISRKLYNRQ